MRTRDVYYTEGFCNSSGDSVRIFAGSRKELEAKRKSHCAGVEGDYEWYGVVQVRWPISKKGTLRMLDNYFGAA